MRSFVLSWVNYNSFISRLIGPSLVQPRLIYSIPVLFDKKQFTLLLLQENTFASICRIFIYLISALYLRPTTERGY